MNAKQEIKERIIERHSWRTDTKDPETDEINKEHNAEIRFAVEETAKEIFERIENFLYFFQAELKKQKLIPVTLEIEKTLGWKELKKQFLEEDKK